MTVYKPSIYASARIPIYLLIGPLADRWPLVIAYDLAER